MLLQRKTLRLGYLISEYPAISHTFISREIEGLRSAGVSVDTFSVRPPASSTQSTLDQKRIEETFYILPVSLVRLFKIHVRLCANRPKRYFETLRLALQHRVPGVRSFTWALFHFAEAIVLAHELERKQIHHLHTHFANSGANVGLIASYFLNIPWSLMLHGISETDYPAGVLLGAKIKAARFVACASCFMRAQAMRVVSPEHWPKLFIVRCALDLTEIPKRSDRNANRKPRLISVGRLSPEKAHIGLLEAFSKMRRADIEAELVIVGDGPERERIKRKVDELNLQESVILRGRLSEEETLEEIASADVLVLASFMEGLPVVLMEAMALSIPVVATRVAGIPELVTENENGLLFCPTDWDELANKMKRLIEHPELWEKFGRAGRAKIESAYSIVRAIEPLLAKFHERVFQT